MSDESIRVVIVDDHPVYREGLTLLLHQLGGIEVVATAADGERAIELVDALAPDVVIMDLRMPGMNGIDATRAIASAYPATGIVVLSMFDEDDLVFAAVRAGARAYLLKDAADEQIAAVIRGVARGETIFGPGTAERLLRLVTDAGSVEPTRATTTFPQLTAREREVLEHIARGRRNAEIADHLFLSERTVRNYVSNIFTKLQVADRAQAIATARDAGLGAPPSSDVPGR